MWARVVLPAWHGTSWPYPRSHSTARSTRRADVMTRTAVDDGAASSRRDKPKPPLCQPLWDSAAAAPLVGAATAAAAAAAPTRPDPAAAVARPDHRRPAHRGQAAHPRAVFDYTDGGAETETSLRRAREAFARVEFRPRVLRDVTVVDTTTTLLGRPAALPLALAPTGFTRMMHHQGERAVVRVAEGEHPLRAVDPGDDLHRGGRRGGAYRPQVVPAVCVARPWRRQGTGRTGPGGGL